GLVEEALPRREPTMTLEQAARETGLAPALVERVFLAAGFSTTTLDRISEDDLALLRGLGRVLAAGVPLVAVLQLVRVYGQAIARIADAEVRLFHLYVHEPLIRSGATGVETAEQMQSMSRQVLPLAGPILDQIHQRWLQFFVEQDVVGHMESDLDGTAVDLGRMRIAIAFADLTGYTRMTEEEGELSAVDAVERFVEAVD